MATYISRTTGSSFTSNQKFTFSGWVKGDAPPPADSFIFCIGAASGSANSIGFYKSSSGTVGIFGYTPTWARYSVPMYRDPAAWYHYCLNIDTTEAAANDRVKLYVNGTLLTISDFTSVVDPTLDDTLGALTSGKLTFVGGSYNGASNNWAGEISHVHYCDGYVYPASTFGETDATSGIWKIKTSPSVTYGTNGFNLKMEDRTNLDLDSSGNAHTFTTTGTLTATYDSPSNNFITLNPLGENVLMTGTHDLLNGNTTFDPTNASNESWSASTLGVSASKWYWEVKFSGTPGGDWPDIGLIQTDDISTRQADSTPSQHGETYMSAYEPNGTKWIFGSQTTSWGSGYVSGDIIMCALDCDNGKLWWGKNGTWEASGSVGDPANGTNPAGTFTAGTLISPYVATFDAGSVYLYHNFGNGYFGTTAVSSAQADDAGIGAMEYDVPAGYYCLCTKNIKAYGG